MLNDKVLTIKKKPGAKLRQILNGSVSQGFDLGSLLHLRHSC